MKRFLVALALLLSSCEHLNPLKEGGTLGEVPPRVQAQLATLQRLESARSSGSGRLSQLCRSEDPRVRARAQEVLARLQSPDLVDEVVSGLSDTYPDVRKK